MQKKFFRRLLRWLILFLLVVILAFSVGTYYIIKNKDTITGIVVNKLNDHLETKINTSGISVSLFKKIPYIAVEFEDVWSQPPVFDQNNDTLFSVKEAYVLLNVFKVISGNYEINKLLLKNGSFNLLIDEKGRANYMIWKKNNEGKNKNYRINLQDIAFENIRFTFLNKPNQLKISALLHQMNVRGDLSNDESRLFLKSNLYIDYIYKGNVKYIRNGQAQLNLAFTKNERVLGFSNAMLKVNRQKVESNGKIDLNTGYISITFNGKNVQFNSDDNIFNLDKTITSFARVNGQVDLLAKIEGNYKERNRLNITTNFNLGNGSVLLKNQKLKYTLQYLKGQFKSLQTGNYDIFQIDSMFATGNGDTIAGKFSVFELNDPKMALHTKASIRAKNLNAFLNDGNNIVFGKGRFILDWQTVNISLNRKDLWEHFIQQSMNSTLLIHASSLVFPKLEKEVDELNADIYLNGKLDIRKFSCHNKDIDLVLEGSISNLYNLFINKPTWIDLRTYSTKIDLLSLIATPDNGNENKYPQHIFLKSTTFAESLIIEGNTYQNVNAEIYYKPGLATLKLFNSNVFGGTLKGNCALAIPGKGDMKMAVIAEANEVDITSLFKAYKEFGQDFITSKNLMGKLNLNLNFNCDLTGNFDVISQSILANADLRIKKGELLEHEPMYSLSNYIRLEELKHIRFADLSNEIYIKDQCVTIPQMTISSSAMDIEISGKHYFDNHFEYLMTIYLSDLLAKKISRNKDNEDSFTYTQRNSTKHFKIPLIMKGDTADFDVQINKKRARENFSESVQRERMEIKNALNREFKIFSKDSASNNIIEDEAEMKLLFEEENQENDNFEIKEPDKKEKQDSKTNLRFEFEGD